MKPLAYFCVVSDILDDVSSCPTCPVQASIQNKFIISVGWDRRVYVWQDDGDFGKEHGYLMRFPDDTNTGHMDDILCVSFCPPSVVATGGYDGLVLLWSINSKYVGCLYRGCCGAMRSSPVCCV